MKKTSLALAMSACTLFAQSNAGGGALTDTTYKLEQSNISATMSDFTLEQQSKSVTILDRKTLLQSSSNTGGIQSVLENAPGILYSRASGLGGVINVRGMSSSSDTTMITIDETRVYGRAALEYNVFDSSSIDSIEIIRGPASALFGSNAMNGVINIKSRRYRGDVFQPFNMSLRLRSLEYASVNNSFGGRLEAIGGGDGFDVLFGLNGRTGQDYQTPDGKAEHSGFNLLGFDWNVGYTTQNNMRYYSQGRLARVENENAGGVRGVGAGSSSGIYTEENPLTELYLRGGVEVYDLAFAEEMDAFLYWRRYDTDLYTHTPVATTHSEVKNSNYVGGRLAFKSILDKHALGYGLDTTNTITLQRNRVNGVANGKPTTQSEFGAFVKDDYSVSDDLLLSASLRADYVRSSAGRKNTKTASTEAITGALGATYFFNENFSTALNLSRNFIAPWVGYTTTLLSGVQPNANLNPEYSHTAELSFRVHDAYNEASISAYYTQYKDKIAAALNSQGQAQWQNLNETYIQGIEWQGSHRFLSEFTLAYLGAYTYGQDKSANKPLSYIAPLYGRISLSYDLPFKQSYIKIQERAYKGKSRIDESLEKKTKSYAMTDVYVGLDLSYFSQEAKDMELSFGIENLFNQKGRNPATISSPTAITTKTNPLLEPGINFFMKYSYNY
ncbi:TonB-dependent receptor [Campylobacter sp. MIT 12-5580]|uniref:TonB-dependent receptor plug domain-containing protein n=1 Tax=Campylobacter sp. MIT 12-5580 TaxID=2040651 RepID=UPI0010F76521|nr:TonB-dependent receptor [Campylobacter sp. MIT 12-5580]TKX28735.1 TonB-dependent receptor [Campylobacter sp. MIT 12-5580]